MTTNKRDEEYLNKAEFAERTKMCNKTVERFANKLIAENPSTTKVKKEKNAIWLHKSLLEEYVSDYYLALEKRVKSQQNTIDNIRDLNKLGTTLWHDE